MADLKKDSVVGMLYIVQVRMVNRSTHEKVKQKILVVGGEVGDIERKIKWIFDSAKYDELSVTNIEKVREKVHVLSTSITQESSTNPIIERQEGTVSISQGQMLRQEYDPKLFAIGVTTVMIGKDRDHALRKVGSALIASSQDIKSHSGAALSDDSTITVEEIPMSSGYALPRDVSDESNPAHFVRG